jgi:hypothetical protein
MFVGSGRICTNSKVFVGEPKFSLGSENICRAKGRVEVMCRTLNHCRDAQPFFGKQESLSERKIICRGQYIVGMRSHLSKKKTKLLSGEKTIVVHQNHCRNAQPFVGNELFVGETEPFVGGESICFVEERETVRKSEPKAGRIGHIRSVQIRA